LGEKDERMKEVQATVKKLEKQGVERQLAFDKERNTLRDVKIY